MKSAGILRSSAVVGAMTMISRTLGLVRDVVIAIFFGATANADAFFVAFKIPQFLRRLFGEGAFSQAFVPVLSEFKTKTSLEEVKHLIDRVAGVLGGTVFIVSGLAVIAAPLVAAVFAPGFINQPEKFALTGQLIRITFPYLFFITLTGFAGGILNSYGKFAVPAFTPVLLNISLIFSVVVVSPHFNEPAFALAWGVFFAGVLQFTFQLPFLKRMHLLPKPTWDTRNPGVRRIITLMIPALFGVSVSQINLMLDTILASFLPTGSVSWLYYSDRFAELPLGVFGIAIATVILPSLSRHTASDDPVAFDKTLNWAVLSVLAIAIPSAVGLILLSKPLLMTLLQYQQMTVHDVVMASYSLSAYASGLLAFMLIKVLAPGFYARQDMKTPVKIGIIAMLANMIFNVALVLPLAHYFQLGHVGLALATALSAYLNAFLLYRGLEKRGVFLLEKGFSLMLCKLLFAAVVMALAVYFLTPDTAVWQPWLWWQRGVRLLSIVGVGVVCYVVALLLCGVRLSQFKLLTESKAN